LQHGREQDRTPHRHRHRRRREKLPAALQAAGTPHRIEWYPGVERGFAFPQGVAIAKRPAAERHSERLLRLLARQLKP
jgi:carboxymethylenebutenolidase